jgi:hypothetical protein
MYIDFTSGGRLLFLYNLYQFLIPYIVNNMMTGKYVIARYIDKC